MGRGPHFALARRPGVADDRSTMKILVPVDFSDTHGRILAAAEAEAKIRGASLVLLHVIEPAAEVAGFETDPEMMRLRIGKVWRSAFTRIENSVTTAPEVEIFSASALFSGG